MEDLEDVAQLATGTPEWAAACNGLAAKAHKLPSSGLVRAVEVLANLSSPLAGEHPGPSASSFRGAAEALLGCLTPQLGTLGAGVVADALRIMGAAKVEEQTYLDMLLARLLVTLRHDRASFTPPMLARIAGAMGVLHEAGVSAKRAASGASSASNRRCVEALAELMGASLDTFGEEELARLGGPYLVAFLDDVQRRAVLRRAAELDAGFRGPPWLAAAMQEMERGVRRHSFAFIASLPDRTKDYLMRLKLAADQALPERACD